MRKLRFLALLAPALLLPLACEDSSSSSGGLFNPEAGPGFEAGPQPEAGPFPEAGADVTIPPIEPKGVTVTVVEGLVPKKDARVITHDATGAVIADLKTDATGKVALPLAPSMVTVLTQYGETSGARFEPITFAGVADGDNLVVDAKDPYQETANEGGSYTVSFGQPFAGASEYYLRVGDCAGGQTTDLASPFVLDVSSSCVGNQNAILVAARAALTGAEVAFGFVKNAAKPAVNGTVAVGPVAFTAAGVTKVDATNLPVGDVSSFADLYAIANGTSFYATGVGGGFGEGGQSFATATGFADAYQSLVVARHQDSGTHERGFIRREATTAPASATLPVFDFAKALPEITTATLAKPDVARPDVTLTSAASLATADGAVATVTWFIPAQEQSGRWTFVLPPTTTAFKVPALPADATVFVPTADSAIYDVAFVEASLVPGYPELKKLPVSPAGLTVADAWRPLPAAGTVRMTRWSAGGARR